MLNLYMRKETFYLNPPPPVPSDPAHSDLVSPAGVESKRGRKIQRLVKLYGSFSFQVGNERRNSQKFPLNKGGIRGLFEKPLQSRIKTTSKRTQETRYSSRGSALESAKIQ